MISRRLRFYNFLIDSIVYLVLVFILVVLLKPFIEKEKLKWILIGVYYLYYLLLETLLGQTVGKMFTKTMVLSDVDGKASVLRILLRTLLRMLPFDFISYLIESEGIHDNFSKTKLVELKQSK